MEVAAGTFRPNDEVDVLDWLSVDEARTRLSYAYDRLLLDALPGPSEAGA